MCEKVVSGKQKLIKDINRNLIIKLIIKHEKIGRADLAKLTNLSLPSVMRITEGLMGEGLVVEVGKGASSGGRKPNLLTLNSEAFYIVGVEIALSTTVVLTDLSGRILGKWETHAVSETSPLLMLEKINDEIKALLSQHGISSHQLAGIGIGTPGSNFKYNKVMELSILKGWEELDVRSWFEERWKGEEVPIITENVARTRTLNELWFGLGKTYKSLIYVFVDQGVGCGFVNHESIFTGKNDVAGEFGHTLIMPGGRACYCGNKGCMEMYVSAGAIIREVKTALKLTSKGFSFDDCLAMKDNSEVQKILMDSGEMLGYGLANLINLYNPNAVVLGGEVPKSSQVFARQATKIAYENIFSKKALETPILVSIIPTDHDCLGSVALVINELFKSVEI